MAKPGIAKSLEARLRLRELSRYYCATSQLPIPGSAVIADSDGTNESYFDPSNFRPTSPHLSTDHGLTALAQLAALRLQCQRSFINIIDDSTQHIIAEATRSISAFDKDDHDPGDGLILGVQSVPINYGICFMAVEAFGGNCKLRFDGPDSRADEHHVLVPDLTAEPKTCNSPALKGLPPVMRYYLEVPLRSVTGWLIGSICVVDPGTRQASAKDVRKLEEVAKIVMEHLENVRMKEDHRRAERLLEGLAHFIRGKDSLSEWSKKTTGQEHIPSAYPKPSQLSSMELLRGDSARNARPQVTGSAHCTGPESATQTSTDQFASQGNVASTPPTSAEQQQATSSTSGTDVETGFDPVPQHDMSEDLQPATSASITVRQTFSRAANLIREGLDLDASCFLEVPQNERFKGRRDRTDSTHDRSDRDSTRPSQSSSESSTDSCSENTPRDDSVEHSLAASRGSCLRLGYSTRSNSSLAGSTTSQNYLTIPAALLIKLTDKYPDGHIFHFDTSGNVSSGDDRQDEQNEQHTLQARKKRLSTRLARLFPTSRSMIFMPMYDNDKQQVYAGFLGWATNPSRGLQKNEMVYVAGFANSIMCEVMRLETLATDKAKSDFISSISHELRSPLHGILAASQLLSESATYPKQAEFLSMIDTCSRTLLDIMDHLLDHAKINHFTKQESHKRNGPKSLRSDRSTYSLVTDMNILTIVEETVASMASSINQLVLKDKKSMTRTTHLDSDNHSKYIPIILNIAHQDQWIFRTEPGSWRRIVMNLVGNALKYTQNGHIEMSLSLQKKPSSDGRCLAELKVTDTGQGISEEYLKHRLYTPFAQENNLSVGAGLGLSLVQKIVKSLQGNIRINSEIGTGTEVVIQVPLEKGLQPAESPNSVELDDKALLAVTTGRTVHFMGFDHQQPIDEQPTGIPKPRTKATMVMKDSLAGILENWFGMNIVTGEADICVIEESYLKPELQNYDRCGSKLLVIGLDGRSNLTDKIKNAEYVYLLPPVGPSRLSQALCTLLGTASPNGSEAAQTRSSPKSEDANTPRNAQTENYSGPCAQSPISDPVPPGKENEIASASTNSHELTTQDSVHIPLNTHESNEVVLLVEDNDINLRILTTCIDRLNQQIEGQQQRSKLANSRTYRYVTATNGREALDAYKHAINNGTRISIIFMDISMPVMDGFTATREIRAFEKSQGMNRKSPCKIVALTGLASANAQNEVQSAGFDEYLRKPVSLKVVRDILMDGRSGC